MKKINITGFADVMTSHRVVKTQFFSQINEFIDWRPISNIINKHYQKGDSASGRPSYSGLLLFKICLLQTWYGLSDYEVEDQVNDRISFSKFVGISLDDSVPDHSVLSRFRTELTSKNAYEKLFKALNKQLSKHSILVNTGVIVDASITDSPREPKGKKTHEIVEDRNEDTGFIEPKLQTKLKSGVDNDGSWTKKGGQFRFGYKQHTGVDANGLVLAVVTTSASQSDTRNLKDVLDKIDLAQGSRVQADKGYRSKENDELLKQKKLKNGILHKAYKNKPLTHRELQFNKAISKTRYKVERTFGSIVRWFGGGIARYVGIAKMHTQHLMQAIAYNLYRAPRIVMPNCLK